MPADAMFIDESKKIVGRKAGKGGFGEVGIGGDKVFRGGVNVREIAAATAGDEDFFANAVRVFEDGHATAALAGLNGAKKACGACAKNENVEGTRQGCLTGVWSGCDSVRKSV